MNKRVASLAPYAAQLLYDEDVRDAAKRAFGSGSKAYVRAKRRPARRAISDAKLRRQIAQAARAVFELAVALSTPPPPPKRRLRKLAIAAVAAGGLVLAVSPEARSTVLGVFGREDTAGSSGS